MRRVGHKKEELFYTGTLSLSNSMFIMLTYLFDGLRESIYNLGLGKLFKISHGGPNVT